MSVRKMTEKREVLSISRLDDLPAEANVDRQAWIEWGIRSNLNIPIMTSESVDYIIAAGSGRRTPALSGQGHEIDSFHSLGKWK